MVETHRSQSTPSPPQFDVVAIGSSAGGVEALHVVASALPTGFPATVLVVQHMDPRHKSMLAGLLARRCRLPVRQAVRGEPVVVGTVYIAPPDAHLIVRAGHLALTESELVNYSRPSIDVLFESVADAYGDLNQRLHAFVRAIAAHRTADSIIETMRGQLVRHQFALSLLPGRPAVSLPEHLAIIEAIQAGDPNAACYVAPNGCTAANPVCPGSSCLCVPTPPGTYTFLVGEYDASVLLVHRVDHLAL